MGLLRAIQNLTIIHIMDLDYSEDSFGRATKFFPLVGLIIGIILWCIYNITTRYLANSIVAAIILISGVIISGGMHIDGYTDSMDGLFSGRSRERKLEIMKDSRVGAIGVLGLISLYIAKFAILTELVGMGNYVWVLITPVISRWCMVYAIRFFPYARPEGMGKAYHDYTSNKEFIWATIFTILVSLFSLNPLIIVILVISLLLTHYMAKRMVNSLGGLTGDTYGAITEIMELILLFMFYLLLKR